MLGCHLPETQGFPSATVMASKLVFLENQPGPRPTLVQSCLEGVSTADIVPRPGQAAPPWPGLLGEVMPGPAALPRRKRLEGACFQEQRGKQLGGRGHSSWDLSWVEDRNGCHRNHLPLKGARNESALTKPSLEQAASLPLTFRPLHPCTLHESVLATACTHGLKQAGCREALPPLPLITQVPRLDSCPSESI